MKLYCGGGATVIAALGRNMSETGMLLEMPVPALSGFRDLKAKMPIVLETDGQERGKKLRIPSSVVWLRDDPGTRIRMMGIRFSGITPIQEEMVYSIVSQGAASEVPGAVRARVPQYILYSRYVKARGLERILGEMILFCAGIYVRRQQAPFKALDQISKESVKKVYDVTAGNYLHKHAVTTHREDDAWRLWLGQAVLPRIKEINSAGDRVANHLDLFSGTGLSYAAQAKVFFLHQARVNSFLVDFSPGMLDVAKGRTIAGIEKQGCTRHISSFFSEEEKIKMRSLHARTVELYRGDAANLTGESADALQNPADGLVKLQKDYFDVATIMFGIGAVSFDMAVSVSAELLKVMKENGVFAVTDMHRPVPELAGRWMRPFPVEFRWAWLEKEMYKRVAVAYVLKQVWAWHDPTLYPHVMRLCVVREGDTWYGWRETAFEVVSRTWDFGMPVMPVYKQVLEKVKITEQEAEARIAAIEMIAGRHRRGAHG